MMQTKIIIELEYEKSLDIMRLRKNLEKLLIEKQITGYSMYQEE